MTNDHERPGSPEEAVAGVHRRTLLKGATVASVLAAGMLPSSAFAAETSRTRPFTIPALQQWTPATGSFTFTRTSRVCVAPQDMHLLRQHANDLASDLAALGHGSGPVVTGGHRPGDIVLELTDGSLGVGDEGYVLTVGGTLRVTSTAIPGLFYGTQSILQLAAQSGTVPAGEARDWPRYEFRGFMLDNGRKYYTPDWIRDRIRQLAYLKYNVLHLHISDNNGFRIESTRHPEIVSPDHLTKQEVAEIVGLAARHHITVVPEIDSPGHMGAALAEHPEFQIERAVGGKDPNNLNFIDPDARRFVRELIEEYLELFPGPWWHIGGDEFVFTEAQWQNYPSVEAWAQDKYGPEASHADAFYDYVNWLDDLMRSHGRRSRMWAGHLGGNVVHLRPTIVNEVWHRAEGFATPDELATAGNEVLNAMYWPTYYVVSPHWYARPDRPVMKDWYEDWKPWEFDGDVNHPSPDVMANRTKLQGGKFHVWADEPGFRTQEQVAIDIGPRLRIMTQKVWGSPLPTPSWLEFTRRSESIPQPPARPRHRPGAGEH